MAIYGIQHLSCTYVSSINLLLDKYNTYRTTFYSHWKDETAQGIRLNPICLVKKSRNEDEGRRIPLQLVQYNHRKMHNTRRGLEHRAVCFPGAPIVAHMNQERIILAPSVIFHFIY